MQQRTERCVVTAVTWFIFAIASVNRSVQLVPFYFVFEH